MKYIKEILLIVSSIILALVFLELIIEVFKPQPKNSSWRIQDEKTGTYLNIKNSKAKHEYYGKIDRISVEYKFLLNRPSYFSIEEKAIWSIFKFSPIPIASVATR